MIGIAPTLTFDPVITMMRHQYQPRYDHALFVAGDLLTDDVIARYLGVDRKTVLRYRHSDQLSLLLAERIADRLGVHPSYIWGRTYRRAVLHWTINQRALARSTQHRKQTPS